MTRRDGGEDRFAASKRGEAVRNRRHAARVGEHEKRLAGLIAADAELRVQPSILARETREGISIS